LDALTKTPSIQWHWRDFNQLSNLELYQLLKLRQDVFVLEQTCLYADIDDEDTHHHHLLGTVDNKLAGYLRVIPKAFHDSGYVAIGRVAVDKNYRGIGLARIMMLESIRYIQTNYPEQNIFVSAQLYLQKFYESLGFTPISEMYLEDDIPHLSMQLNCSSPS